MSDTPSPEPPAHMEIPEPIEWYSKVRGGVTVPSCKGTAQKILDDLGSSLPRELPPVAKWPLVLTVPEKFRKTLDAWKEIDKDLEEFVDGLSPEEIRELLVGTPRPKGTADPVILWLMERIRALEDRIRHPVIEVKDEHHFHPEIGRCLERITVLEHKVRELESLLRVQTALMVDVRLAVKGLQKP